MKETAFLVSLRKYLNANYRNQVFVYKTHGNQFTKIGMPDLILVLRGTVAFAEGKAVAAPKRDETPLLRDAFTARQIGALKAIELAGGLAYGLVHVDARGGGLGRGAWIYRLSPDMVDRAQRRGLTVAALDQLAAVGHGVARMGWPLDRDDPDRLLAFLQGQTFVETAYAT